MFTRRLQDCKELIAADGCKLRELLHPDNEGLDLPYSMAIAQLSAGQSTTPHFLQQTEVYYFLSGEGVAHVGEQSQRVSQGDLILVPPEVAQWVENTGTEQLSFAVVVSPPWQAADDVPVVA